MKTAELLWFIGDALRNYCSCNSSDKITSAIPTKSGVIIETRDGDTYLLNESGLTKQQQRSIMNPVISIVEQSIGEEKAALTAMKNGTMRAPWANDEQHAQAIAECEERIASMQSKLDDHSLLQEWWDSIPEEERNAMLNM